MKKICKYGVFLILIIFTFLTYNSSIVNASEIIDSNINQDIFGDPISSMKIYKNGKVELEYKYGLRKVDIYYCIKGEECDNQNYQFKNIMESNESEPYKGDGSVMTKYEFFVSLEEGNEYRVRVEAYFGTSNAYTGTETINGAFTIGSVQILDTKDQYIGGRGAGDTGNISDSRIRGLMDTIITIVNKVVLPVIYAVTSLYLVVKGTLLGVQIVKSADDFVTRREKIGALKWLVVGVAVTYAATTLVGVISGFFKGVFNLNF